jgi:hypothetical protein
MISINDGGSGAGVEGKTAPDSAPPGDEVACFCVDF